MFMKYQHCIVFSPWRLVQEGGVDPILRGLFATPAKQFSPDEVVSEELTERLFEVAHAVALDLAAVNIQRGRDHGLPSYADYRQWCGLGGTHSWHDLSDHIKVSLTIIQGGPSAWVWMFIHLCSDSAAFVKTLVPKDSANRGATKIKFSLRDDEMERSLLY